MENSDSLKWRASFFRYAPILLWIGVIFFLSGDSGSMTETSRFVGPILKFLFPDISEETFRAIHGIVRKTAHFTEYAVLAFLAVRALSTSSIDIFRRFRFILPLLLVISLAVADEFNQSFEASRTSSVWDSLLDISGGAVMILFLWMWQKPAAAPADNTSN